MFIINALVAFWKRLSMLTVLESDDAEERLKKSILTFFGLCILFGLPFDIYTQYSLGNPAGFAGLLLYWTASAAGLFHFTRAKNRKLFQQSQFALIIFWPATLHVTLGGFHSAGELILWGALAPFGSFLLSTRREAAFWFYTYLSVLIALLIGDPYLPPPHSAVTAGYKMYIHASVILGFSGMIYGMFCYFVTEVEKAKAELQKKHRLLELEQEKSEKLLLNILPGSIAERLKASGTTIADGYAEVSVLFADLVGFTKLSAGIPAEELVKILNEVFSSFDRLAARHGIEKIKTIGDAYMAAAGLPEHKDDHAMAVAEMAMDMVDELERLNRTMKTDLEIRIGLNTGPVVAGVIGMHKFIYDLWGDTVNTASRMESNSEPGRIHVTEAMYDKLKDHYRFEPRGEIQIKGKGMMKTYFLAVRK